MPDRDLYQTLADLVLLVHFATVAFVVGGLALIIAGNLRAIPWVNTLWFRLAHLATIGFVVVQAWWGATCPLTLLENWLRQRANSPTYAASFIEHWLQRILFCQAPSWVFTLVYTVFGLLVAATWFRYPPTRRFPKPRQENAEQVPGPQTIER